MEETPNIIISILKVFNYDAYALLDPRTNLSFITPSLQIDSMYVLKYYLNNFNFFTLVGKSIITRRVYRGCMISNLHTIVPCNLLKHTMVDFDIILRMTRLYLTYYSIDYRTRRVKF